jgi:hypothetical protein
MQPFQFAHRRMIFMAVFALLVILAGISVLSHGALAHTSIGELTNQVFLPLVVKPLQLGGSIPH